MCVKLLAAQIRSCSAVELCHVALTGASAAGSYHKSEIVVKHYCRGLQARNSTHNARKMLDEFFILGATNAKFLSVRKIYVARKWVWRYLVAVTERGLDENSGADSFLGKSVAVADEYFSKLSDLIPNRISFGHERHTEKRSGKSTALYLLYNILGSCLKFVF